MEMEHLSPISFRVKMYHAVFFLFLTYLGEFAAESSTEFRDRRPPFITYWNLPTFQCARYKLGFDELAMKYNIIQNKNDTFRGDRIALLYDPGLFPAILPTDELKNGGVPQEGDLARHLRAFEEDIARLIPDANFAGLGIIDFEDWRPIYRQNFGTLAKYKDLSEKIERQRHWFWSDARIKAEAARRFEESARAFMEGTLKMAQRLRPRASWGYYGFPHCFNNDMEERCAPNVQSENDRIKWLFATSDTLNPSLYLRQAFFTPTQRVQFIKGRVREAQRIAKTLNTQKERAIIPYYTVIHPDTDRFLSERDVVNSISTLRELQVDGLIVWGSSKHVNTQQKCEDLYTFIDTVFGPALNK
ncbi:hyaluronidase-like [Photinus pyralis]|nr:hyaluronidase-like [Photinus pyralis]